MNLVHLMTHEKFDVKNRHYDYDRFPHSMSRLSSYTTSRSRYHEPIKASELPKGPWKFVEIDCQGPYPNGEYIFVMIERYSHWLEIVFFRQPQIAKTTINVMQRIFANKGIPVVRKSDNGQPFQSAKVKPFASKQGFALKHITPEWPRANGTVERFNRCMTRGRKINARCSYNLYSVLPSEPT